MSDRLCITSPLRPPAFDLLELLAMHPDGMTRDAIAHRLNVRADSATRRLYRLALLGLVDTIHETPQTAALARISTKGREQLAQAFARLDEVAARLPDEAYWRAAA